MKQDVKDGASTTAKEHVFHSIMLAAALIIGLIVLLAGYILLAPRETITYYDAIAGRHRTVTKLGYIKIGDEVKDTYFTTLYKKYISPELPSPDWWYAGSRSEGVFGTGFSCTSQAEELMRAEHIDGFCSTGPLFENDESWRKFTKTFVSIYTSQDDKQIKKLMASDYLSRIGYLRNGVDRPDRPLRADELPSLEEIRPEAETRYAEWRKRQEAEKR